MKFKKSALAIASAILMAIVAPVAVLAESYQVAGFFPPEIARIFNLMGDQGICAAQYINSRIQFVVFLVLGGIVVVAVAYSIIAGFKYIQSKGDPGQIEEANKSIKAIMMGIAAMIVGIIGITLVFTIFGAQRTDAALLQTCINFPQSKGCKACKASLTSEECVKCEETFENLCNDSQDNNKSMTIDEVKEKMRTANCI